MFDLRGRLRAVRPRLGAGRAVLAWALLAAGATGVELYGRRADAPHEEVVAATAFAALAYQAWRLLRPALAASERPARWRAWLEARRLRFGVDLRGAPALEPGVPRQEALALGALFLIVAVLLATREAWPGDALRALRGASGLLASGVSAALWSALLVGTLSALVLPMLVADALLRGRRAGGRRRESRLLFAGGASAAALVVLALLLPPWAAPCLALCGVLSGAWLYLPATPPLRFAWTRGTDAAPRACPAALFLAGWRLFHYGLYLALVVASLGAGLGGGAPRDVTAALGLAFAWSLAGASALLAVREARHGWGARRANPAAVRRSRVSLRGAAQGEERRAAQRTLGAAGFEAVFDDGPADAALHLAAVPAAQGWPRAVTAAQLGDPALHRALARRAELQARRRLRRGVTRLLREARARRRERDAGIGHWVAPHLWFVVHMGRDGEEELDTAGTPYHRLLPRSARSHLFVVLGALEVDLLFVEDGVSTRSLERVLSLVFEFYDLFGERRLEERHFAGLPGVRVLLEELGLREARRPSRYPEPDYEQLARARVLHVFRDRGADPERDPLVPRRGRRPRVLA